MVHKLYSGLSIKQLITNQSRLKIFMYCQYDQAIRPRVDLFILLKPKIFFFRGKMTLEGQNNHDNRQDNNNQI